MNDYLYILGATAERVTNVTFCRGVRLRRLESFAELSPETRANPH